MHRQSRRHDIVSCGVHVYIKKEMMEIAFQSLKLPFLKASTNKLLSEGYPGVLWVLSVRRNTWKLYKAQRIHRHGFQ